MLSAFKLLKQLEMFFVAHISVWGGKLYENSKHEATLCIDHNVLRLPVYVLNL